MSYGCYKAAWDLKLEVELFEYIDSFDYGTSKRLIDYLKLQPLWVELIGKISSANEVKGLVSALMFWFLWFYQVKHKENRRSQLLAILVVTIFSIALGRALANFLPFRSRPKANPEVVGSEIAQSSFLEEWSSMPSDHAIMFFALSTGFFIVSRKVGTLAFLHATLIVCLPRLLLGLHYVSDIVVGAAIGILLSAILVPVLSKVFSEKFNEKSYPDYILYPFLFFMTYSFATMFNGVREVGGIAKVLIQKAI